VKEYIQTIYDSIRSTTGSSSNKMSFSIRADECNHPELRDRARVALSRTDAKLSTRDCYIFLDALSLRFNLSIPYIKHLLVAAASIDLLICSADSLYTHPSSCPRH
jgi:hypothetical protein